MFLLYVFVQFCEKVHYMTEFTSQTLVKKYIQLQTKLSIKWSMTHCILKGVAKHKDKNDQISEGL